VAWWRRAWDWLSQGKRWMILPAVLAGVAALVGLLRGRRDGSPSPGSASGAGPAPTGEAADDAREVIREAAADEEAAIKAEAEAQRERIRKAMERAKLGAVLLVVGLLSTGCPRPPAPAPLPIPSLDGICDGAVGACDARVNRDTCEAAMSCVDAQEAGKLCYSRLKACEALAAVDVGEQAAYRAAAEARMGELEDQRWWWGAGGVAVGALLAGLLAGLAGR
jgi:hypothetical protein